MKNFEGLSREEIIRLIEEEAKKVDATVTKNEEGLLCKPFLFPDISLDK